MSVLAMAMATAAVCAASEPSVRAIPAAVQFRAADGAASISFGLEGFDAAGDFWYEFYVPAGLANPCQFLHFLLDGKEVAQ